MELLGLEFFHNTLYRWIVALAAALIVFTLLSLLKRFVLAQLQRFVSRTRTDVDNLATEIVGATRTWYFVAVAVWAGALFLALPRELRVVTMRVVALVTLAQIGIWLAAGIRGYVNKYSDSRVEADPASVTTVRALGFLATVVVWAAVILVALDNLGIEVTAMIAGLGIGGVAVALAVQNILGDLFASLSIVLDKPFVYGDFIIVDDMLGTVEKVGLKTTRIRSLSGEQLVFSNSDLLRSRIRNYKRMFERRVVFNFRLRYDTPRELIPLAAEMAREAVEAQEEVRFDRSHFSGFGEWALQYEVVYYVLSPSYNIYMDRQQAINLTIMDSFTAAGIEFAYPTRTVFMQAEATPA